jgi:precorrin-6B methylase 2
MGIFQRSIQKRRIKAWRQGLALDAHEVVFKHIYQSVDGFALSKLARSRGDALEYVYGEIDFEAFIALLSLCQPHADSIFYDLGSGVGKAVLAFQMVFHGQKSCGIELFPELNDCAQAQKEALAQYPQYQLVSQSIQFTQGDFLSHPLQEANLLFINSTAFLGDYWQEISQHLEQELNPGTRVISTSKALRSPAFQLEHNTLVQMSFGGVQAFIHQRL